MTITYIPYIESALIATCGTVDSRFSARLHKAALAFLRDHAVHGRVLCPATALLEAAVASGRMLLQEGSNGDGRQLLLRDTSFVKALLLTR